jgi:hypothetical protein
MPDIPAQRRDESNQVESLHLWRARVAGETLRAMVTRAMDPAAVEAIAELTLRLSRVMRPEYVMTWLRTPRVEALEGGSPIDLIARGEIAAVARVVSGLESPGAV